MSDRAPTIGANVSDAMFRGLLEAAPDAIMVVDQDGHIQIVNQQAERLFGYARGVLEGKLIEVLVPQTLREHHRQVRTQYIAKSRTRPIGVGRALTARHHDGHEIPVEISLSPFPTEHGVLIIAVIRDTTARHRAAVELEQRVQQRTAHLNTLLQFSGELLLERGIDAALERAISHAMALVPTARYGAIYLHDPQARRLVLHASAGFGTLPAMSRPDDIGLLGQTFTSHQALILNSADEYATRMAPYPLELRDEPLRLLALGAPPTGVITIPLIARSQTVGVLILLRETGGGPFAIEAHATLEGLANQTAAAILAEQSREETVALTTQLASIEEQRRRMAEQLSTVEAGLLQAARLAAVGQLAASIAHEINNPLYAARNCLFLIEEDLPPAQRDSPYLTMARDQLARIAGIIEHMRDFIVRPAAKCSATT